MKHIVCYSGGEGSALCAYEVVKKYGKENVILINHDINANVEHEDIKRFKNEVAEKLELSITYVNHPNFATKDQFDISIDAKAFKAHGTPALCTNRLKTKPFMEWLEKEFPLKDCILYYGFEKNEIDRIERRSRILGSLGYRVEFPLTWDNVIKSTNYISVSPPLTYSKYKHANCVGCLKGGMQHWYLVYCDRPDIYKKAVETEKIIGYSILKQGYLDLIGVRFEQMRAAGIVPTEKMKPSTFWAAAKKIAGFKKVIDTDLPCACAV